MPATPRHGRRAEPDTAVSASSGCVSAAWRCRTTQYGEHDRVMRGRARDAGHSAEKLALAHLRRRGLRVVDRNFRTRHGEIDLVMLDGSCLVFVEVRYRALGSYGSAVESVDRHKRAKLAAAAGKFLATRDAYRFHTCRFDVVGIDADAAGATRIDWRRDAFRIAEDGF